MDSRVKERKEIKSLLRDNKIRRGELKKRRIALKAEADKLQSQREELLKKAELLDIESMSGA